MRTPCLLPLIVFSLFIAACGQPSAQQSNEPVALTPTAQSTNETTTADLTSPTSATDPAQASDPTLRIVTSFKIQSLDPVIEGLWFSEFGAAETLLILDDQGAVQPHLLESFEQMDDRTWQLILKPDITFQNGKPLDATALAATMQRQLELSDSTQALLPGATVAVSGDREVTLTTQSPDPAVPAALATEGIFPIYDAEVVEAVGDDFAQLAGSGFYTGPYQVASLNDEALILERFTGYWQGVPPLSGVSVAFVPDVQARILAVQNGEADLALYPPTQAMQALQGRSDAFFVLGEQPSRGGPRIFLNLRSPPFDDRAARQAFMLGIDYTALADDVMDGTYRPATGLYPEQFPWSITNLQTDVVSATQLLDAAGWVPGADGVRVKDGVPLRVVTLIYPQQPDLVPIMTAVQAQLQPLGFDVQIQQVDDIYAGMLENSTDWNAGISFEGSVSFGGAPEPALQQFLASDGEFNFGGIANPELDQLVAELGTTFDPERRNEILQRLQAIIVAEEAYQFYLAFSRGRVVVGPAYRDYQPSPHNYHVTFATRPTT